MPTKRGRRAKPAEVEEELEVEGQGAAAPEVGTALELEEDVLGELDDEGRYVVSIFRKIESGARVGKPEYVGRITPPEFSLDLVRERFGGGTYEFRVLRRDDRGKERYHRTRTVHIAGAPRPLSDALPAGGPVAVVPPPASEELRLMREELERSRRARAAMRRKLEELERRPPAPPLEWLKVLAPVLLPLLKPSRGGTEDFVRALELGVKLGGRGGGGDDSPSGVLVDKALGVVQTIMQGGHPPNGAASSSSQPAPGILPGSTNGAGSDVAAAKLVPLWLQKTAPYLPVLASWARAGDDPASRVGFVLGALDSSAREELGAACEAEDFVPRTLAAMPAPFREPALVTWTTRFLQLVQEELAPVDGEEAAP